jgi:hypothetical protein
MGRKPAHPLYKEPLVNSKKIDGDTLTLGIYIKLTADVTDYAEALEA